MTDGADGRRYSYLDHLESSRSGEHYDARVVQSTTDDGFPLLVRYDLDGVRGAVTPADLSGRPANLWRYHELLPIRSPESVVTLGESITPLLPMAQAGHELGLKRLSMKDEGLLPTGTFKARGAAVGVSRARELGVKRIAMPTNGNAGAAWSAYAARAGIEALVVMPTDAPAITRAEITATGGRLYLVDGVISDAGAIAAEAIKTGEYADASTLKEPYRLEGKKTMGLELFEQLGWRVPDVIMYPTGGGVGLIGIYKALLECQALGWLGPKVPRLVAVQADGCAPIVKAWDAKRDTSEFWPDASTIAFGITVPKALGDFLVLDALRATSGRAVAVSDTDILATQALVARSEGAFICPEGAACFAAARTLVQDGWLAADEEVVIFNTGAGIKYPTTVEVVSPTLQPGDSLYSVLPKESP